MADYTPQPGRGSLFKQSDDKPASWSGKVCLPSGEVAFLDLYPATNKDSNELRKDRDGNPWYNVRIKLMDNQRGGGGETYEPQGPQGGRQAEDFTRDDLDDSIPFVVWGDRI